VTFALVPVHVFAANEEASSGKDTSMLVEFYPSTVGFVISEPR